MRLIIIYLLIEGLYLNLDQASLFKSNNNSCKACEMDLKNVQFEKGYKLSDEAKIILTNNVKIINSNPTCYVKVIGHGNLNKAEQQMSMNRADVVTSYLIEKLGVSRSRIYYLYGQDGDPFIVEIVGVNEIPTTW